jgi:hypothetical protein
LKSSYFAAAAIVACLVSGAARAADTTTVVTPTNPQGWSDPAYENNPGGSAAITSAKPFDGNGSVEFVGDRSREIMGTAPGNQFNPASNIIALNQVTGISFSWAIDPASSRTDYSPALRLHIQDGAQRSELVYEAVYNAGDLAASAGGAWVTTDFSDLFWQNIAGSGVTLVGGAQENLTVSDWIANHYSSNAYVTAISLGQGSGATDGYHAFGDDVILGTTSGNRTFNFEVSAGGVPEPATWGLMLMGFGGLGAMMRRRRAMALAA